MSDQEQSRRRLWIFLLALALGLGGTIVASLRGLLGNRSRPAAIRFKPDLEQFQGLTEEEASSRRPPALDDERKSQARKVRRDIWVFSTFSIFNLSMLGLGVVQILLGDPLSALLTIAVMVINIGFNAAQQLYATGKVEKLLALTQPKATAIREGKIRSIEIDEVVDGDVLVVGPGDEFLADGRVLSGQTQVFEAQVTSGQNRSTGKEEGDHITAGSYCAEGHALYAVTTAPGDSGAQRWTPVQKKAELTPLQRIITRILRILLLLIVIFMAILILDLAKWPFLSDVFEETYREVASVFFSIAPSGLFFMIVATYAIGSARLGDMGAVVRDSRALESLAQVSVLCFSKTGPLTGAQVDLDMAPVRDVETALTENRTRHILGDMAHSVRSDNIFLRTIRDQFPGDKRPITEIADFLSAYGWSAMTFTEADAQGTYVLGEPAVLEMNLQAQDDSTGEEESSSAADSEGHSGLSGSIGRLGRLFRRDNDQPRGGAQADSAAKAGSSELTIENDGARDSVVVGEPAADAVPAESQSGGIFVSMRKRFDTIINRDQNEPEEQDEEQEADVREPQLLFAYVPEPQSLAGTSGEPRLPIGLTPLCYISFEEQVRPEAIDTIRAFTDNGVRVKILSSDDPSRVLDAAEQIGLVGDPGDARAPSDIGVAVSGFDLSNSDEEQFNRITQERTVFGQLTPEQKDRIVVALRRQDERVAMMGDGVEDVAAMEKANLSIALQRGNQAALNLADIVLLEDSLGLLPTVLERGQFIVNGMLDIIKVNLAQIGYIVLLIVVMLGSGQRIFYYHPTQGGVIAFFTVIIPSIGLTFWASSGTIPRQYMRSRMVHFVLPAAVTMAAAALAIAFIFERNILNTAYSELAVTHGLIAMGLLLIVFVQPPSRFWVGGDVLSGDMRPTYMAIVLFVLFIAATILPLTQELLRLSTLEQPRDYLIIGAVVLVWMFVVRFIWRASWLDRYVGIMSDRLVDD